MLRATAPWLARTAMRRAVPAVRAPLATRPLPLGPAVVSARRWSPSGHDDDEFVFDAAGSVAADVTRHQQAMSVDGLVMSMLPPGAPREAYDALVKHFRATPINECIRADTVVITHVENEAGEDSKMKMPPMPIAEALQTAKDNGMDLVQLAEAKGSAYCRLRKEKAKALAKVAPLLGTSPGAPAAGAKDAVREDMGEAKLAAKLKDQTVHQFRDVVDAHFVGWRSKKIVTELSRRHPVKLVIAQFVSAATAVNKMREMCAAIEAHAKEQAPVVAHYYTSLQVSEKDLVVLLQPATKEAHLGQVKHPSAKDWVKTMERLDGRLSGSGRRGTYQADTGLKRRNVGARTFRTDKYGRRIDD